MRRDWLGSLAGFALGVCALTAPLHAQPFGPRKEAEPYRLLKLDGNLVRWHGSGSEPTTITYRVLREFQAFEGARNCRTMTGIAGLADRSRLQTTQFDAALREAFSMWEDVANIRFREAAADERANIIVGAQHKPEGWAFADVFYDARSAGPFKPISLALVCLNPEKLWKFGFDGDLKVYDLRYTLAHEIGHAIGLDHPNAAGQIMGYRYEERFSELQPGDADGAATLYGAAQLHDRSVIARMPRPAPTTAVPSQATTTSRALHPR